MPNSKIEWHEYPRNNNINVLSAGKVIPGGR
jgi:hypothetical protein